MGHPHIDNQLPYEFEPLFVADDAGRIVCVTMVKGTYAIDNRGQIHLAESQVAINKGGEYWGDAETSSYKYEPECAFTKLATDIVLIGHAYAPADRTRAMEVGFQVGPVRKIVRVSGDRFLVKRDGTVSVSKPRPFERIPLTYERAFGGWDRTDSDRSKHSFETRNPVGTGFRIPHGNTPEPIRLPNIEAPDRPWRGYGDRPPPAGFGFIGPNWEPRVRLAGTYDSTWDKTQKPLLANDFDRRYFNAASPGLIAPGYLRGNEPVIVVNASDRGRLEFRLPGIAAPCCAIEFRNGRQEVLQTHLDTVIVNTDDDYVLLIWRQFIAVPNGPEDVAAIAVGVNRAATIGAKG